jgi:hypothetical protein
MAYTPPLGNVVPLNFAGAYTAPIGNVVPLNFADPEPPDPEPEVPIRWTGRGAALPWTHAPKRSRHVCSSYSVAAQARRRTRLPWSQAPQVAASLRVPWTSLPSLHAHAWWRWTYAPAVVLKPVGIPWGALPRVDSAASLPWTMPPMMGAAAPLSWRNPPRLDLAASMPWTAPPRLEAVSDILWMAPPDVIRRWWLPWGYADRVRWRVRGPGVDPPDVDPPWQYEPPQGNRVAVAFACPQLDHPGNQVPVPFGRAACYFAWPKPRRYIVLNSAAVVRLPERTPIPVSAVSLSSTIDDAFWTVGLTLADPAALAYLLPDGDGLKVVEINLNGHVWTASIESHTRNRRFPTTGISVSGRSQACTLDAPYAQLRSLVSDADAQAQSLAEAELDLSGITLDYDTLTWLVPAGAWRYDGATPIGAVKAIAAASGAVLQSHPWDTELRIAPRYPVSPWLWNATAPAKQIHDDMIYEDTLRVVSRPLFNYVLVSGEQVGVSDEILREGSAGDVRATMVVDPLIVEHDVAAERGRNVLCDRGEQAQIDLTIPLYPASAPEMPGLVLPLQLVQVHEVVAWKGLAVGVQIEAQVRQGGNGASALVIDQRITLERHYTDAG